MNTPTRSPSQDIADAIQLLTSAHNKLTAGVTNARDNIHVMHLQNYISKLTQVQSGINRIIMP